MIGNRPPPHLFSVKGFLKHGSIGVCRRFAIHPARILCVAGYFRCIGAVPVQVFPAPFSVATVSLFIFPICPYEISARRFWWCGFLSLSILDRGQMEEDGDQQDSDGIVVGFSPNTA